MRTGRDADNARMAGPMIGIAVATSLCAVASAAQTAAEAVGTILQQAGITKGICSVPRCGDGSLAAELAGSSGLLVHAFDPDPVAVDATRELAEGRGLLGTRMVVERLAVDRLPYADSFVDLVVLERAEDLPLAREAARVLRPGGLLAARSTGAARALRRAGLTDVEQDGEWTFARARDLEGADDWSHWYHGPDNNPVSTDTHIRAPYITQWLGAPFFHAMPVVTTAADGRIFVATGHIAHHQREVPTLNTLVARNGYNGQVLWERKLPEGYLVHRSAFIATDDAFYMLDGDGCLVLDPETGEQRARLSIPGLQDSWTWMAMTDGVLYVLASEDDQPAESVNFNTDWRGWGWSNVEKNYFPEGQSEILWGFGSSLAAWSMDDEKLLWTHTENGPIDSRGLGILDRRLFYYIPGTKLACLDRSDGRELWTNEEREKLALIEERAMGLPGTPGFQTASMVLCTPVGLFIQGQKRANVVAFDDASGRFMWARPKYHNNPNMLYHDGRLLISGIDDNGSVQELDPNTGGTLELLNFWKGSCTRLTGSPEALYCRGDGLGRYGFAEERFTIDRSARPGCNDGAIPANGLLYVGPWLCDCNQAIQGLMVLGPAGDLDPHGLPVDDAHLDVRAGDPVDVTALRVDEQDWETYRGDVQRSASSPAAVPEAVRRVWLREGEAGDVKLAPPTSAGGLLFTGGDDGTVRCIDAATGDARWTTPTGGPIMVAPTLWQGRAFVGSADGYVHALEAASGRLLWRFRVAPIERRIMLYGRLSSTWPVNSGVVVRDGVAYAAAGLINRDGTYVCALDAETGDLKWHNSVSGRDTFGEQLYQAASAMGGLTVARGKLWLASGNTIAPAGFDLETGAYEPVRAERIPEWNTLIALKPEPAGREVLAFRDEFLLHGGRILYNQEGLFTTAAQFNVRAFGGDDTFAGPAFTPFQQSAVPPAWDDDVFVYASTRYSDLLCWDAGEVGQRFAQALEAHLAIDKPLASDQPEKWDRRVEINRGLRTFEAEMRKTGKWPPVHEKLFGVAVARNAVVCTSRPADSLGDWAIVAYEKQTGEELWRQQLPSEPRFGGLAIDRDGRALVVLRDGGIACYGAATR